MTHSGRNKPCVACNACGDKRRKKVLHVAGERGRPVFQGSGGSELFIFIVEKGACLTHVPNQ